ncbi:10 kDa chaperonin [Dokdonia pacifica]|uniref:Co-chaperonin GroES n=1 Tax=Dokdonia pacifica TaxID=1627892 RepID=A0A239DHR5_9FLAO|nr:co-chaperone GroES [Dokdonia pacifica]GGG36565.1 10 kDa chaperonin [Dokdonia pacifica]SNS31960.1 chaperonin GroES [Dokdonia pacifica]
MALNIKPLADRVVIEPLPAETQTASGLYIPDSAQEKQQKGKVVAVGSGKKDYDMTVKTGDTVIYGKYAGTELKLDGKDYMIMKEEDILAIV